MKKNVLIIGAGPMSETYVTALKDFNVDIVIVGRGEISANSFYKKTGILPITGGLDKYLQNNSIREDTYAIIATGTEALMHSLKSLIKVGIKNILVEKPAAISIQELVENETALINNNANIFVAYNRRFYASVLETINLIREDGGLKSMHFEFTEWVHTIQNIRKAEGVKENLFFANSTHVVDLAFFLAGNPVEWSCYSLEGKVQWHKKTNYTGAGITSQSVLFSYISNWESAGRWALELLTEKRRIYLKPLEEIQIQLKGSVQLNKHEFDNSLDEKYKPGVYLQVKNFLEGGNQLLQIEEHIWNSKNVYAKILL